MDPRGGSLEMETAIARRVDRLAHLIPVADSDVRQRADNVGRRLDAIREEAAERGLLLEDVEISLRGRDGAWFVVREGWIAVIAAPFAWWGWVNHWIPFRAARAVSRRSVESAADPAMRMLVAGSAFVVLTYLAQTAIVVAVWGWVVGALYLISLPIAAEINFGLRARFARAKQRARTYLAFRRDRALRARLQAEIALLRDDVERLDRDLGDQPIAAFAAGGR
jgi:hypothetical protein